MIKTKDIREGKLNGSVVWICDYRHNDYSKNLSDTFVQHKC